MKHVCVMRLALTNQDSRVPTLQFGIYKTDHYYAGSDMHISAFLRWILAQKSSFVINLECLVVYTVCLFLEVWLLFCAVKRSQS